MGVKMQQTILRNIVLCFFMDGCLFIAAWCEENDGIQFILAMLAIIPVWMALDMLRAANWYDDDIS